MSEGQVAATTLVGTYTTSTWVLRDFISIWLACVTDNKSYLFGSDRLSSDNDLNARRRCRRVIQFTLRKVRRVSIGF
jgi:hypothetical protein